MAPLPQRQTAVSNSARSPAQLAAPIAVHTQTRTQTQTQTQPAAILRLRGGHNPTGRSVQWSEDVVDNEGLGRKKSKVCCIYHRPKGVDESSDESSSDSSSSSSDSDSDGGGPSSSSPRRQRATGSGRGRRNGKKKHHHDCDNHDHGGERRPGQEDGGRRRKTSPNAYEKMPKYKPKDQSDGGGGSAGQQIPNPAT